MSAVVEQPLPDRWPGGGTLLRPGWMHYESPSAAVCAALHNQLGVGPLLRHALDPDEVARVDRDGQGTLVVLRVAARPAAEDAPGRTATLGLLLLPGKVLTVAAEPLPLLQALAGSGADPMLPTRFVLAAVLGAAEGFLAERRRIDRQVSALEESLQGSQRNREVLALLRHQQGLVHFTTALRSDQLMVERLRKERWLELSSAEMDFLEDVLVELHQASEMVQISENILAQMMDAFASIISNNLNMGVRALTALTLVLNAPILVASLYGMNVALPGQHQPQVFIAIMVGSTLLTALVAWLLWRRRWLT